MKLHELCRYGREQLCRASVPDAAIDARLLLCEAMGIDTARYLAYPDMEVPKEVLEAYLRMIEQRAERCPLQYIVGYTEFMGLRLHVNDSVLIPRQDTELLCELVLSQEKGREKRILDLCTGSGAIALSLCRLGGYISVLGTDISKQALSVAEHNRQDLGIDSCNVGFYQSDLFESLPDILKERHIEALDVIVSNPPYIRPEVIEGLEPEVRDHEPYIALFGGSDGLSFYRSIADRAAGFLAPCGSIYVEIGSDQGAEVSHIFQERGYRAIAVYRDMAGHDRVVSARI